MIAPRSQITLSQRAQVTGRGYWTGKEISVEFRPAPINTGLVFVRDDLTASDGTAPRIPLTVAHQTAAQRRTVLSADVNDTNSPTVEMVEHIAAALMGLGVDNCEIGVTGSEMPGLDGSALEFVAVIDMAGFTKQDALVEPLVITQPVRCTDGNKWIEARPPMGDTLSIEYNLDYGSESPIRSQWLVADVNPATFRHDLAAARTFLLKPEADALRAQGLGSHVTPQDLLIFGTDGPIDNALRFADECVRHKTLDVVGDLALAGRPIIGHIVACRSGHRLNADLVRALLASHPRSQSYRRIA